MFKGLKIFEKAEFAIMLALAFAIPFHWFAAQCCEAALVVCAILKIVFEQKFKFNKQQLRYKWAYIVFALTWLVYLVGMFHTENDHVGWMQVSKKLGFLIFPAIFLLSDMSYLNKDRVRCIFYSLLTSCLLFFGINMLWSLIDSYVFGNHVGSFTNNHLMRIYYVHHIYISMYAILAMTFSAVEYFENKSQKLKRFNMFSVIVMIVFVVLLDSRAGLLSLLMVMILLLLWMILTKRSKKMSIITAVITAAVMIPFVVIRLSATIEKLSDEDNPDIRMVQYKGNLLVVKNNWLIGVGTGDRTDAVMKSYVDYKEKLVNEIKPKENADKSEYLLCKQQLLDDMMEISYKNKWNNPTDAFLSFIDNQMEEYECDTESVKGMAVEYIYVNNAITHSVNAHNQYLDTLISVGIVGLLIMLAGFIVPLVMMIRNKRLNMVYLSFIMMIMLNALFESVFEMQVGIIFYGFFNAMIYFRVKSEE